MASTYTSTVFNFFSLYAQMFFSYGNFALGTSPSYNLFSICGKSTSTKQRNFCNLGSTIRKDRGANAYTVSINTSALPAQDCNLTRPSAMTKLRMYVWLSTHRKLVGSLSVTLEKHSHIDAYVCIYTYIHGMAESTTALKRHTKPGVE